MGLELALYHAENYKDPYVREDLQQLIASLAAQLGQSTLSIPTLTPVVRRGTLTIPSGSANATQALTPPVTDLTRAELRMIGFRSADGATATPRKFPSLELDESGTFLFAQLGDNASGDLNISWELTEWTVTRLSASI